MESYILDWLNLLFRWMHIVIGAAWIGASFYFNWLNHNIRPPENDAPGIKGELFAVHGGAFYQVLKYDGAPEKLPKTLHWFKYEAYFTWVTGIFLLAIVYYWNAEIYLIDKNVMALQPWQAVGISVACVTGSWLVYDLMCRSPLSQKSGLLSIIGGVSLTGMAYFLTQCFSGRAAFIHMGVIIGTIMAANVFFVIIPNQRKMVDAMIKGEEPDVTKGQAGALRSLHNNYLTLPVLFIMVSNHFPMTYGHTFNWAVLAMLAMIGGVVRHHFNLKSKGRAQVWVLPAAAVALVALALVSRPTTGGGHGHEAPREVQQVSFAQVQPVFNQRCVPCHAAKPSFPGMNAPPLGSMLETYAQAHALKAKIKTNVSTKIMPPGNVTELTPEERFMIMDWVDSGAKE